MTDEHGSDGRENRRTFRSSLWDIGFALIFSLLFIGFTSVFNRLFSEVLVTEGADQDRIEEYKHEFHDYVWGLSLALLLTVVPFALVYWSAMSPFALYLAIGSFALVQGVVHFRFFLHIDPPRQNVDDLHLILFSGLVLFFMAGGTIWILANLATRMMP